MSMGSPAIHAGTSYILAKGEGKSRAESCPAALTRKNLTENREVPVQPSRPLAAQRCRKTPAASP